MQMNKNEVKLDHFHCTESGKIYAVLKESSTPLGLKVEGRPYIGRIEPDDNQGRIRRHKTYDYCEHFVGNFISQDQSSQYLFNRWKEFGMGAKIVSGKMPFRVSIELEILVMADSENDALDWTRRNRDWHDMIDDSCMYADPMTYVPSGWDQDSMLFGNAGDVSVKSALKIVEEQKALVAKAKKEDEQ